MQLSISEALATYFHSLGRCDCGKIVWLLTGYFSWQFEKDEASEYFLCFSSAFARIRVGGFCHNIFWDSISLIFRSVISWTVCVALKSFEFQQLLLFSLALTNFDLYISHFKQKFTDVEFKHFRCAQSLNEGNQKCLVWRRSTNQKTMSYNAHLPQWHEFVFLLNWLRMRLGWHSHWKVMPPIGFKRLSAVSHACGRLRECHLISQSGRNLKLLGNNKVYQV